MFWPSCCTVLSGAEKTKVESLPFDASETPASDKVSPRKDKQERAAKRISVSEVNAGGPNIGIGVTSLPIEGEGRSGRPPSIPSTAAGAGPGGQGASAPVAPDPRSAKGSKELTRTPSRESPRSAPKGHRAPSKESDMGSKGSKDELMPYTKKKSRKKTMTRSESLTLGSTPLPRRRSISCMEQYLSNNASADAAAGIAAPEPVTTSGPGSGLQPVTKDNVESSMIVVRGRDWQYGDEDGGDGQIGTVFDCDKKKMVVTVFWRTSNHVGQQYRCGKFLDLAIAPEDVSRKAPKGKHSADVDAITRRNSQFMYAMKFQTVIIFDWDDTLFPTTYVRDDMELAWQRPMKEQRLDAREKAEITKMLDKCAENVIQLLKLASTLGKVILVTLARNPWVMQSCANFYEKVGTLIEQLDVPIVYAQTGVQVDYDKMAMASNEEIEKYWSGIKGRAIANEVKQFYSQYEGQSWKNIISIGDSDFERLGTQAATADYMKQTGLTGEADQELEVDNHVFKVRTKTFKLVDQPTIEELTVEVAMLQKWLPLMVNLDTGFDVNLNSVEDPEELARIEKTLYDSKI